MITYSESLFNFIVKSSITTEKSPMVDIRATREAYNRRDISDVDWVGSAHNLADGLTKFAKRQPLVDFLDSGRLTTEVEQWVLRKDFYKWKGNGELEDGVECGKSGDDGVDVNKGFSDVDQVISATPPLFDEEKSGSVLNSVHVANANL